MFWFLLISLAVVVAAVTLAVVGSTGEGRGGTATGGLADAPPDQLDEPLPAGRPVSRVDVDGLRLPVTARGYRMQQVDDVLDRLGAELAERDARIAELESALAGAQAAAMGRGEPGGYGGPGAPRSGELGEYGPGPLAQDSPERGDGR
ncbi:cell division protein DivIVA [Streptomyces abyssalis]|uniref:Cell division protein DivIVA n=1 Tax=Streptomyces abyssalis TaxID=933944 RepID=A0A1E7JG90_9ACTN|nr:cell division protein DivIVA [Streptomyces abyssalis]OEU85494.1 cell division protein DivIVA [Streptomyces abyssalis]OEU93043.1 cell division protein DivIVA [Streptomyces abyssalis]